MYIPRFDLVLKHERLHCASVLENNGMSDLSPHFKPRFSRVKNSFANCSLSSRVTSYLTHTFFSGLFFRYENFCHPSMTPQSETKSHSFVGGCHVICTQQRVRPPTQTLRSMSPDRLIIIFSRINLQKNIIRFNITHVYSFMVDHI